MGLILTDKTSSGNTLTNINGVAASSSVPFATGSSGLFTSASSEHLATGTSPTNLNLGSSFTIEAWAKTTSISTSPFQTVTAKWGAAGHRTFLLEVNRNTGGKFSFLASYDGTNVGASPNDNNTAIGTGTWHHIALTYDNTTYRWYLDGSPDGTTVATNGSLFTSDAALDIGSGDGVFFDGNIAEVRIWSATRSSAQILANYNVPLAGNEANLVGYWLYLQQAGGSFLSHFL